MHARQILAGVAGMSTVPFAACRECVIDRKHDSRE
jgi:hypothetical protein